MKEKMFNVNEMLSEIMRTKPMRLEQGMALELADL